MLQLEVRRLSDAIEAMRLERRQGEALEAIQHDVLERIARGQPLATVLDALVGLAEVETGMRGSVLLCEDGRLRHGAAPSLPEPYSAALDEIVGLPVYDVLPGSEAAIDPLYRQVRETLEPLTATSVPVTYLLNGEPQLTYWDASLVPYLDARGRFDGWLVLAQEVSERLALMEERDALSMARIADLERVDDVPALFAHRMGQPPRKLGIHEELGHAVRVMCLTWLSREAYSSTARMSSCSRSG